MQALLLLPVSQRLHQVCDMVGPTLAAEFNGCRSCCPIPIPICFPNPNQIACCRSRTGSYLEFCRRSCGSDVRLLRAARECRLECRPGSRRQICCPGFQIACCRFFGSRPYSFLMKFEMSCSPECHRIDFRKAFRKHNSASSTSASVSDGGLNPCRSLSYKIGTNLFLEFFPVQVAARGAAAAASARSRGGGSNGQRGGVI